MSRYKKRFRVATRVQLCCVALAVAGMNQASAGRLSLQLLAKATANDNTPVSVIVRFNFKNSAKGRALFKELRVQLRQSRAQLGPNAGGVNKAMKQRGSDLWLYQSIALDLSPVQALALATLPIVDEVFENFKVKIPLMVSTLSSGNQQVSSAPSLPPYQWKAIGLDQVRAATSGPLNLNLRGQGVRIGHLDTGVDAFHPELSGKVVAFAEFDAGGERVRGSKPHDSAQHGTHTAGLLVGDTVGVAPDAKLISALVLPNGEGTFAQVIAGMQWVLDPDNNADTDDGANIVSMSLGMPEDHPEFILPVKHMLQAGVVPVFAIGNFGPDPSTTGSPGNIPGVIGVGAVDQQGKVADFSSRGPVLWPQQGGAEAVSKSFIKPDVVAPGVEVVSSISGGGYAALSGTSQAAPLVAGALAVMLGAKLQSSVVTLKNALFESASLSTQGLPQNNDVGYGLINLPAALAKLGVKLAPQAPAPTATDEAVSEVASETITGPAGYTFCAAEGQVCSFSGQKQVAFGAQGRYLSGLTTDGFNCTVTEWGSDPLPGKAKACFIKGATP